MNLALTVVVVMVSLAMTAQSCSAFSFSSCSNSEYDIERLVDRTDDYELAEMRSSMLQIGRYIYLCPFKKSVPVTLKPYIRYATLDITTQLVGEMVLALEEVLSEKKPKCDETMHQLVYRVFQSARPLKIDNHLKRYIDYCTSAYVDICLPVHLKTIGKIMLDEPKVVYVSKLMQNLIEETRNRKDAKLSYRELFNILREYRSSPSEPLEPIAMALYRSLVELGDDETRQLLSQGDEQVVTQLLNGRLIEPSFKLSAKLLRPSTIVKEDLEMSPRLLTDINERLFKLLGIGLSCSDFWLSQYGNTSRLASLVRELGIAKTIASTSAQE